MTTGSYQFESLENTEFQTERLQQQAQAVRGIEANLLRSAGIEPTHDVLEVGSGPGFVTSLLAELAPQGSVHALEPSPALLAQIQANVTQPPAKGLFVHQGYGNAIPCPTTASTSPTHVSCCSMCRTRSKWWPMSTASPARVAASAWSIPTTGWSCSTRKSRV